MGKRAVVLAAAMLLAGTGMAQAQVAWDSPFLTPPRNDLGVGIYLIDPEYGDIGAMVTWRNRQAPAGFGLRGGIAEDFSDDIAVFGGIDFAGRLVRHSSDFPLDVDWVGGFGASVSDNVLLSVPFGLTTGRTLNGDGVDFTPYATPRVVLDAFFGDDFADEVDLDFGVDLGIDVAFQPTWLIRFGATLGRDAIAIGVVF